MKLHKRKKIRGQKYIAQWLLLTFLICVETMKNTKLAIFDFDNTLKSGSHTDLKKLFPNSGSDVVW